MLNEQGYIVFRGLLTPHQVEQLQDCIDDDLVHYTYMQSFINNMLQKTNRMLGPDWNMQYIKYRVSDNNNSDAGGFHRDVQGGLLNMPVFTCLTYLDKSRMELIPGSHRIVLQNVTKAVHLYRERVRITINPGDVMLFHSSLVHRGIFTDRLPHRRLVQVFDVFKNEHDLELYANKFVHVLGKENMSDSFDVLNRTPVSIYFINIGSYLNAITGYGNCQRTIDKMNLPRNITHFSSEGFRERIHVEPGTWQPINKYIINIRTQDLDKHYYDLFKWELYNRQYTLYAVIVLVILISIPAIIFISFNLQ